MPGPIAACRAAWLTAVLLAGMLAVTSSPGAAPPQTPGTHALGQLDRVVVVYPATPAPRAEINRLSGQRRAGFIRNQLGVEADFVADDELTEEQRRSHLLLLGWDNRVLGGQPAPRPFRKDGPGHLFLESIRVAPTEDLMFSTVSPFDPERRLFFWSRIDLELDKFNVLPFMGSDWTVYRGYEVVRQGMFENWAAWPPVRNPLAEAEFPDLRDTIPVQGRSEHYILHYEAGLVTERERDLILEARETALAAAVAALRKPQQPVRISVFLFPDSDTKNQRTGVPDPVHSLGRTQEMFMLPRYALTPNPHEEIHLIAQLLLGPCHHTALHEGLAMALEQPQSGGELAVYAAALVDAGEPPTLARLLDEEGVRVLNRAGLGFPAAGLMMSWLLERGGLELLGEVYSREPLTVEQLAAALGVSAKEAENSFATWVRQRAAAGDDELRFQKAIAEARGLAQQEDHAGAIDALRSALELRPNHPDTLYRLALAEMRVDRLDDAQKHLRQILESATDEAGGSPDRYVIFAHYQLGQVLERLGNTSQAREQYRAVLDLPDRHDSHRMAREALEAGARAEQ
jgi:hypothetical protein